MPCVVAALTVLCGSALASGYAVKPAWWDTLPPLEEVEHRGNPESTYHEIFRRTWERESKSVDPRLAPFKREHLKIRAIAEALADADEEELTRGPARHIAGQAVSAYLAIEDLENAAYWIDRQHEMTPHRNRGHFYHVLHEMCRKERALVTHVTGRFEAYIVQEVPTDEEKEEAVGFLLRLMGEHKLTDRLFRFLDDNQPLLDRVAPRESLRARLQGAILKGDAPMAEELLRRLEAMLDEGEKARVNIGAIRNSVEGMQGSIAQYPVDWDFDSTVRTAEVLAGQDKDKLHRHIRSVLMEKRGTVLPEGDNGAMRGAHPAYQDSFAQYASDYNASILAYLVLLKDKLGYDERRIEGVKQQVVLRNPRALNDRHDPALGTAASVQLPGAADSQYYPLLTMTRDAMMLQAEAGVLQATARKMSPAGVAVSGERAFFQNSREIVCLEGNTVRWRQRYENAGLRQVDHAPVEVPAHRLDPVADRSRVYARIRRGGVFGLHAFDQATGRRLWQVREKGYEFCSDPVLWKGTVLSIAKIRGEFSQYALLFIDPANGSVWDAIDILGCSDTVRLHGRSGHAAFDCHMPVPTIVDDIAYLVTNYGLVAAIDLRSRAFVWERAYDRLPFSVSQEAVDRLTHRRLCSPVVSGKVVVCAPADAATAMVLDRQTGAAMSERIGLDWAEIHQAGKRVLMLAKSGKAQILDAGSLETAVTLPGSDYEYIDKLADGVMLKQRGKLQVWNERGELVRETAIPESFVPVVTAGTRLYGYDGDSPLPQMGYVGKDGTPPPGPDPAAVETSVSRLENAVVAQRGDDTYLLADNYLVKVADDLKYEWSVPRQRYGNVSGHELQVGSKYLYLVNQRTVDVLDRQTGARLGRYPEYGQSLRKILAPALSGDRLYLAEELGAWTFRTTVIEGARNSTVGTHNGSVPVCILKQGELLGVESRGKTKFLELDAATHEYRDAKTVDVNPGLHRFYQLDEPRRFRASDPSDRFRLISDDMTFIQFGKDARGGAPWRSDGCVRASIWSDGILGLPGRAGWSLIDIEGRRDLASQFKIDTQPLIGDGLIHGAKMERHSARVMSYDIKTGGLKHDQTIKPDSVDENWGGIREVRFAVSLGGKPSYLFQMVSRGQSSREALWVLHDPDTGRMSLKGLPDTGRIVDALAADGKLLLFREKDVLQFKFSELASLAKRSYALFTLQGEQIEFEADGYPDEWPAAVFNKVGTNSFAMSFTGDAIRLGCSIRDERIIEYAGTKGMDDRFELVIMPGSLATFVDDYEETGLVVGLDTLATTNPLSYSVKPTGDELFLEMEVPLESFFKISLAQADKLQSRRRRGDVAFDIAYRKPDGSRGFIFARRDYAAFFPRVYIPDLKERAGQ